VKFVLHAHMTSNTLFETGVELVPCFEYELHTQSSDELIVTIEQPSVDVIRYEK
jgi:hypothetical protein